MKAYKIELFSRAREFVTSIPEKDRAKVFAHINTLQKNFSFVNTRLLKHPIKELKIKNYRVLFFIDKETVYLVSGFVKKSQKTPILEIKYAIGIYNKFKNK